MRSEKGTLGQASVEESNKHFSRQRICRILRRINSETMSDSQQEMFGGTWTREKLSRVQKYLSAYCQIFKEGARGAYFQTTYVDAFAGTGYLRRPDMPVAVLFPDEFAELSKEAEEYSKGSALRALEVKPGFDHYIFVENDPERAEELQSVADRFPHKDIKIAVEDANTCIQRWCRNTDWRRNRAVVFLDPFGMQVEWKTIEAVATTRAIDIWILFPIFGVNRMLVRHGKPPESWRVRLTSVFGTDKWEDEFYTVKKSPFFEGVEVVEKTANITKIAEFFINRLKRIFEGLAEPLVLRNKRGAPLFVLAFAAGNKRGAPTALRIARHILTSS